MEAAKAKRIYIEILDAMIKCMSSLVGEKIAMANARKAPILITPEGELIDFYGEGEVVVDILLKQYESLIGGVCIDCIKKAIHPIIKKNPVKLPERLK